MAETLYSRDILRLATRLKIDEPIALPDASAELRSSVCGSAIKLAVQMNDEAAVEAVSMGVNACAVGQASAAILQIHARGLNIDIAREIRDAIAAYLAGNGKMPSTWGELSALAPVREFPARHAALLLPYDALLAAMGEAIKMKAI